MLLSQPLTLTLTLTLTLIFILILILGSRPIRSSYTLRQKAMSTRVLQRFRMG